MNTDTDHPPCGLLRRLASMVYDSLLILALLMAAGFPAVALSGDKIHPGTLWFQIWLLGVWWAYFAICWKLKAQTVGMRAWRIHLVHAAEDKAASWWGTIIRFLLAFVSAAAAGLGFLWALFDPEKRCWHDLASGTRLVVHPRRRRQT